EVAILATIMALGTRLMMRVQFWLFVAASAGLLVAAITLLVTSHGGFISDYNSYARPFTHHADTYNFFLAQAKAGGTNVHAPTSLGGSRSSRRSRTMACSWRSWGSRSSAGRR